MRPYKRYNFARRISSAWRFNALRVARWTFKNMGDEVILSRPFYKHRLYLNAARSNAQQLLWLQGQRFVQERFLLASLMKPGMTVLDIGANIGYYALLFDYYLNNTGKIVCVEPEENNLIELRKNILANRLSNVQLIEAAAGSYDGETRMTSGINGKVSEDGERVVSLKRIDSLGIPSIDFIKCDVEGYEGAVLEGALETIRKQRPKLFVEIHPDLLTKHNHGDLREFVAPFYRKIDFYESKLKSGFQKFKAHYLLGDCIAKIENPHSLLRAYESGHRKETCWMVCQN